ncbi:MAG TPA: hypothetical protein VLJ10_05370, partial [Candidatus Bathyarchaeia archaeon]|nr:hypothetical protein [Candidatus Bathyarchaeia archaeon]
QQETNSPPNADATNPATATTTMINGVQIQPAAPAVTNNNRAIFDDTLLLEGFTKHYLEESQETLLAMIQDETIEDIKGAAAVRAFRQKYALKIFNREKMIAEHILLRQWNRTESTFIELELMHTLCLMDRYQYFGAFVPKIIQKMDHYNDTINQSAYNATNEIIEQGNNRAREARIVFNTLRKILFLSRRRLAQTKQPDERLQQKLDILKWSIKVLGSQELRRLPKEVLNLL